MTKTKQVLLRAAELVKANWCQGMNQWLQEDGTYAYCALGATFKADEEIYAGNMDPPEDSRDLLREKVMDTTSFDLVSKYNDATERTKDEVVALILATAAEIK